MKRRHFLQLVGSAAVAAPVSRRPILRTTRFYPEPGPLPKDKVRWLPEVLPLDGAILSTQGSVARSATPAGESLWEREFPGGPFNGLGTANGSVLLARINGRVLRFNPYGGEIEHLGAGWLAGGRCFYAGDGRLIRLQLFSIEVWNASGSLALEHSISCTLPANCRADQISDTLAMITSPDSDSVWFFDTATGRYREYEIDFSSIPSITGPFRATGVDRANHFAYILLPVEGASVIVTIDPDGTVTRHGSYERRPRQYPVRVMKYGNEIGIARHNGSIAWYAG